MISLLRNSKEVDNLASIKYMKNLCQIETCPCQEETRKSFFLISIIYFYLSFDISEDFILTELMLKVMYAHTANA